MPITAVAFDFGGVLTVPPTAGFIAYAQELGLPDAALSDYFFAHHPMMAKLEVGDITGREFFRYVCTDAEQRYGVRIDSKRLGAAARFAQNLDPAMIDLVAELGQQCPVALVTNNVTGAEWRKTFPYDLFRVVLDSSEINHRKPDPHIYLELVSRLGVPPEEIAFVDDNDANIVGAEAVGLRGILFDGIEHLRKELDAGGLATR